MPRAERAGGGRSKPAAPRQNTYREVGIKEGHGAGKPTSEPGVDESVKGDKRHPADAVTSKEAAERYASGENPGGTHGGRAASHDEERPHPRPTDDEPAARTTAGKSREQQAARPTQRKGS